MGVMVVNRWTGGHLPPFQYIKNIFAELVDRVAKWSALQTGKRGDSGSIPVKVKTFFEGIKSLEQNIAPHFELN